MAIEDRCPLIAAKRAQGFMEDRRADPTLNEWDHAFAIRTEDEAMHRFLDRYGYSQHPTVWRALLDVFIEEFVHPRRIQWTFTKKAHLAARLSHYRQRLTVPWSVGRAAGDLQADGEYGTLTQEHFEELIREQDKIADFGNDDGLFFDRLIEHYGQRRFGDEYLRLLDVIS